ncbi:hypothetical protein F511_33959 [Dorcoceras hygrometricum]|uniref:Uncharacterized protein n=1 Tax=Dorcoceras hygrometricum TaxID=472368 RepID=A0A2Z7ANY0_9LAMI|nr:hypothetical protein F511_33959 [Dorcoceras hygrometricum]
MSLFDLQDECIAIGSLATLDLPMVVDLIVIYGLKGPYIDRSDLIGDRSYDEVTVMGMNRMFIRWTRARWAGPSPSSSLLKAAAAAALRLAPPPPPRFAGICSGQLDEENPSMPILSGLLVQADEVVSLLVVDLIDIIYRRLP